MQAVTLSNWQSLGTYPVPGGPYDQNQLGLGSLMVRRNDAGNTGKWIGPSPVAVARPFEQSLSIPPNWLHVIRWSSTKDWVFYGDNAAAAATRRIGLYQFDRATQQFSWEGAIILTFPSATNHTLRSMRVTYDKHNAGTVAVSGTTVTGTGTTWQTDGACVGNRIGFGSTDPMQISTWYEITAIGSNTSLTLDSSPGTLAGGTAYVIEDLRVVAATTNATATNGGLFVAKGLRPEIFIPAGTAIPAATTVDNIRAVYWLADAGTVTNTVAAGTMLEPAASKATHHCWVVDGTTSIKLFKYNLRAALTLTAGKATNAFVLASAAQAVTGTGSQTNNGRYAVANHGPGSGQGCGYLVTTTRIYRTLPMATITNGGPWQADAATEVPPGGTNTFAATGALAQIEYLDSIDRFLVISTGATSFRSYLTQYRTDGGQFDRILFVSTRQIDQANADSASTPHPNILEGQLSTRVEGGMAFTARVSATATGILYAFPIAGDWEYAASSDQRIVLPKMETPAADRLRRVLVSHAQVLGGATAQNLGLATEPLRILYRTTGIADNSGQWTVLDDSGDLSAVSPGTAIQFALEFRTVGLTCIPARVYAVTLVYDDTSTDSHYQPSVGQSSTASKRFAWRQAVAFGGSVPALRIRLYDAVFGTLLLDDNTDTPTGTWERSTNGGAAWSAWINADKTNETTYVRYTPASLADNIRVRAILTQK
jgi:hypothetical protein